MPEVYLVHAWMMVVLGLHGLGHEHMRRRIHRHWLLLTGLIGVKVHGEGLHPRQDFIEVCCLRNPHLIVVRLILVIG